MNHFFPLFILFYILGSHSLIWGAACCGSANTFPSIVGSDDQGQLATQVNQTEVLVESVNSHGIWTRSQSPQHVRTMSLSGGRMISDRWQMGFGFSFIERKHKSRNFSGMGDFSTSLGYEFLPDWNYNPWRPRGVGILQIIAPTGKSKFESDVGGLDSRGRGQWMVSIGGLFQKSWINWDAGFNFEGHHIFSKKIRTQQFDGEVHSSGGKSFGPSLGYSRGDFRLGSSLIWTEEDPVNLAMASGIVYRVDGERYATVSMIFSYLPESDWQAALSFSDQSLFGDPINTSLGRGVTLTLQRRWPR